MSKTAPTADADGDPTQPVWILDPVEALTIGSVGATDRNRPSSISNTSA